MLSAVLYGCETWSVTLREEHRLRVLAKRVLREIFGAIRDGVIQEWRKLHDKELYELYCSPNIIWVIKSKSIRWEEHAARMGVTEKRTVLLQRNVTERDHLEDEGVDGRKFKWTF